MQELIAIGNDRDAAEEVARNLGGISYLSDPDATRELQFCSVVRAMTDDLDLVATAPRVGLYLGVCRTTRDRPYPRGPGPPSLGVNPGSL